MAETLTLPRPDDWHLHLRDGAMMAGVLPATTAHFARALIMPNLVPPVVTGADAQAYRARILALAEDGFTPLMTLYLTEATEPEDVVAAHAAGLVTAVKLYPAGATTNSASGVRDLTRVLPLLETLAEIGLTLAVHGEVTDADVDIFDREARFLETVLAPLQARLPELRVTLEHITTREGVAYVRETPNTAGTLTVQHLMLNRNALLAGGLRPHNYCLPVLKRETHRQALRAAATSGEARFFLGTDSAPHTTEAKEAACGCAGCFTAPVALACLAQVFEEEGALDKLPDFVARHGAAWYGLPTNAGTVTLARGAPPPLPRVETGAGPVTVFDPGQPVGWHVAEVHP